ncbi:MAG: hypothetical protein KatS3mg124_0651 [Porticoccaceae bacterium]|nr:MAG: hypothetical protein KatS3mg124_0651 [Porticoccaceae bacterium]
MRAEPRFLAIAAEGVHLPGAGRVRAGYLMGLPGLVARHGADPRPLLEGCQLDPSLLDDPDNDLSCVAAVDLLEHCAARLRDPLFGVHLADVQEPDAYGCVIALARAAPTFGQALRCFVDFTPLSTSPECELELLSARDVVELRWRTHIDLGNRGQTACHGVVLMIKILRMLGRERFRPRYANLVLDLDRERYRELERRLGCRIRGNAAVNAIGFGPEVLDAPIATANRTLYALLKQTLTELARAGRSDLLERVEAAICRQIAAGACSVEALASTLGTSTRTLQKRLARAGRTYSDLVQSCRIRLARQLLAWTDHSLDEVAFRLGYAEQTSFGRAFKRHTGLTPREYRQRARLQEGESAIEVNLNPPPPGSEKGGDQASSRR